MSRSADLLIDDLLESCRRIAAYTDGMDFEAFVADTKTFDAVLRNLSVIGEVANRLPEAIKGAHPTVPWGDIVGLRNRVVHAYFGVDEQIIWDVVERELPALVAALGAVDGP